MGGNAIPGARRIDAFEYSKILISIADIFFPLYNRFDLMAVKSFFNKNDFGDIDFIINDEVTAEYILNALGNPVHTINSNVVSLDYDGVQLDFIRTPKEYMDSAYRYFAYNDLGNLMGRIVHKFGFKYGHKGISYCLRDGDHLVKEIFLDLDTKQIMDIFGFDYDRYIMGFRELTDIFQFVTSSKYFSKDIYQFDNMNHRSRVRDAKRKSYNAFLKYIDETPDLLEYKRVEIDKAKFLRSMFRISPSFKAEYDSALINLFIQQKLKSKFNGEYVSSIFGIKGKELGAFLSSFKSEYGVGEILHMTSHELYSTLNNFYSTYKTKEG